jgi:hypothetical protein
MWSDLAGELQLPFPVLPFLVLPWFGAAHGKMEKEGMGQISVPQLTTLSGGRIDDCRAIDF